jgi:hypothetical protein
MVVAIQKAIGGTNAPENLRCLCRKHNQLMAEMKLGSRVYRQLTKAKILSETAIDKNSINM